MESRKTVGSGRRRILHTCGVSGLAIALHAYAKAQDLNGPIGSMAKRVARIAKFIEPLLYALQYRSLALLSFVDDWILAVERIVEIVFPPSKYVFNKIDRCVQTVDSLPGKFDDATNKVYLVIHQFPLLDWLLLLVISWLNFWVSVLMKTTKEKEIMVDKSCTECNVELPTVEDEASKEFQTYPVAIADGEAIAETPQAEEAERVDVKVMKSTYEEELDKGTTENTEKEDLKQSDIGDTGKEDQKEKHAQQSDTGDTGKEDQKEKHAQQSDTGDTEKEDQEEKHAQQSDIGHTEKEDQEEKHAQQSDIGHTEKEDQESLDQEEKLAQQSDIGDKGKEDQEEKHAQQSDSGDTEKEDQEEKQPQQSGIGDTEKEDQKEEHAQQSDIGDTGKKDRKEEDAQQSDIGDTVKKDRKEKVAQQSEIGEKETNEGGGNNKNDESSESKVDILELFDVAWHK